MFSSFFPPIYRTIFKCVKLFYSGGFWKFDLGYLIVDPGQKVIMRYIEGLKSGELFIQEYVDLNAFMGD